MRVMFRGSHKLVANLLTLQSTELLYSNSHGNYNTPLCLTDCLYQNLLLGVTNIRDVIPAASTVARTQHGITAKQFCEIKFRLKLASSNFWMTPNFYNLGLLFIS